MRITKKDIYKKYSIEFKDGKLFCDPLNTWFNPMLPIGTNTKVGDAATWSIYHGNETLKAADFGKKTQDIFKLANITEIKGSCPCHCKGCYCDAGFYCFDSTKSVNVMKLTLARLYPDWLERALKAQIEADKIKQIRIHASGDFFSAEYVDMWRRIALAFKDVTFWTYTKNKDALKAFHDVDNLHITPSVTPYGFNFGTCCELLEMYKKLTEDGFRVHICGCGTKYERHCSDCNHGCKAIGKECDFVLFIKHSTRDYKAGEHDADDFRAICDIIAKQNN